MAFGHFIRREYEGRAMTLAFSSCHRTDDDHAMAEPADA